MDLTAEQAKKILDGNLRNLAKKVKAGKVLTRAEQLLLQQAQAGADEKELSMQEIAKELGLSRQTLYDLIKKYPKEVPKGKARKLLSAWQACIPKLQSQVDVGGGDDSKSMWEIKKLKLACESMQIELDRRKGRLVPADEVASAVMQLASRAKGLLRWYLESQLPPRIEGLSAVEARAVLVGVCDEICKALSDPISYESELEKELSEDV